MQRVHMIEVEEPMTIELSNETKQKFAGRALKKGDVVLARMRLSFQDPDGNELPDEICNVEATCSRIENDRPSFIAINPYHSTKVLGIRQIEMPFVESKVALALWSWTWLWVPLSELREGAVFETQDGVRAVKTEYRTCGRIDCYLLKSGECAHFAEHSDDHNATLVREIEVPD